MDATAITAVIGLLATMSTAIGVPFIQGHIASKRNFATKSVSHLVSFLWQVMAAPRVRKAR
ncbi:hypothetical protein ACFS2C_09070, partial [Prauserella oleivorans]